MYIRLFETNLEAVKSSLATFFWVFPNGTIWGNPYQGQGHDMVLLGTAEPLRIDLDAIGQRRMPSSLSEIGMNSAVDLFATLCGGAKDLAPACRARAHQSRPEPADAVSGGLGLDLDDAASIYAEMPRYRRFPEGMFVSPERRVNSLRAALSR